MTIRYCYMCRQDPMAQQRYGRDGFAEGIECPICYQPACRYHLATVRWRWRDTGEVDAAQICRNCLRSYEHRRWDTLNRDWIT